MRQFTVNAFSRGQASAEYVLILGVIIATVAVIMVAGFQSIEMNLALSAVRLGGIDFTSGMPYFSLGVVNYSINSATKMVNISPRYTAYGVAASAANWNAAQNSSVRKLLGVFEANVTSLPADSCVNASYMKYCVWPVITYT